MDIREFERRLKSGRSMTMSNQFDSSDEDDLDFGRSFSSSTSNQTKNASKN